MAEGNVAKRAAVGTEVEGLLRPYGPRIVGHNKWLEVGNVVRLGGDKDFVVLMKGGSVVPVPIGEDAIEGNLRRDEPVVDGVLECGTLGGTVEA